MKLYRSLIIAALAIGVAACQHAPKEVRLKEVSGPDSGLIYGQIILPNKDWRMRHVMVQKIGKVYGGRGWQAIGERIHLLPDGRFIAENVKPGKYMLGGFFVGNEQNTLGKEALKYQVEVKAGGVHYLGSYRYVFVRNESMFRAGEFDLEDVTDGKVRAELLTWVEAAATGTQWQPRIRQELAKYRRFLSGAK